MNPLQNLVVEQVLVATMEWNGMAQTGPAQTGPAQQAPAQTGPAQTGPAQTGPAETGPAQQAPAQQEAQRHAGKRPGLLRFNHSTDGSGQEEGRDFIELKNNGSGAHWLNRAASYHPTWNTGSSGHVDV